MTVPDDTTVAPRKGTRSKVRLIAALAVLCVVFTLAGSLAAPAQRMPRSDAATRPPTPRLSMPTDQPAASPSPLPAVPPPTTAAPRSAAPSERTVPLMSKVWRSTQCFNSTMRFAGFAEYHSEARRLTTDPSTQYLEDNGNIALLDRFVELRLLTAEKTRDALGMDNATDFCVFGWEGEFSRGGAAGDTRSVRAATGGGGATARLDAASASRLALFSGPQKRSRLCVDDDYIVGTEGFTGTESSYVDFMVRPCAVSAEEARRVGGTREAMISTWHAATLGRNGLGLVVAGDSVLRQLVMRYIAVERGQVEGSEHYIHDVILYVKYGVKDRVIPFTLSAALEQSPLGYFTRKVLQAFYPAYYDVHVRPSVETVGSETYGTDVFDALQVKMTILYMWMVNPRRFHEVVAPQLNHPRPPPLFTYFGYHRGNRHASQAIAKIVSYFRASNSRRPVGDSNRNFLITNTLRAKGNKHFHERNNDTRNLFAQHSLRQGSVYLFDYDAVAAAAGPLVRTDRSGTHMSCSFTPMFPRPVTAAQTTHDNCRDVMGLNALMWLTQIIRLAIHDMAGGYYGGNRTVPLLTERKVRYVC